MTRPTGTEPDPPPHDQFAYVDRAGAVHLPIDDEAQIRFAIVRWGQTDFESHGARERARRRIVAAARRHGIHLAQPDQLGVRIR